MSILSTNHRLIKVGQEYSAGENIDIQNYVISSKDWMSDITAASANAYEAATAIIPEPQDLSYISARVDEKLDSSAFVPSNFYTTGEANALSSMLSGAIDYVSANADNVEVTNVVQSNSGTWNGVSSKQDKLTFKFGTTSGSISSINGSAIIDDYTYHMLNVTRVGLTNLTRDVSSNSATWSTVTNKLDSTAFSTVSGNFYPTSNPLGFITGVDLSNYYQKNETSSKEEIANAIAGIPVGDPDVNSYVQSNSAALNESTNVVESNSAAWFDNVGDAEVNSFVYNNSATINSVDNVVQSNSATWGNEFDPSYMSGAIDNKLDESAFADVSGSFLTAHQSLDGYATEDWVTAQGYITGVDLTPYYTTAEANTLSSMLSGAIDYVSANAGDEFPASANEAITAYQTNSGTYLTAHQIIPSAKWEDASDCVQTNSATWGQGGGTIVSPKGTIIVDGYNIEASNSAVVGSDGYTAEGPVASPNQIGPTAQYGMCHVSNIPNTPYTDLLMPFGWAAGEYVEYSANNGSTGSFQCTSYEDPHTYTISVPNCTEVDLWTVYGSWITLGTLSAAVTGSTTAIMELAPLSALPTYNYDLNNAITGINGSAIGGQGGTTGDYVSGYNFASATFGAGLFQRTICSATEISGDVKASIWTAGSMNTATYSLLNVGQIVGNNSANWSQVVDKVDATAFNELKASYDALSSLFATYSGQWLLPNGTPEVQYVLSSMTAMVTANDGTWDHGGDFGMTLPVEVSAFTEGLSQGALTAFIETDYSLNKAENIRFGYSQNNLPDNDFCGTWTANENVVTAVLSGFGANSAAPTGFPVYLGFPYLFRSDVGTWTAGAVEFSGYVPVQQ